MTKSINHFEIEISSENDDEANELNLNDTFELKKHKKKEEQKKLLYILLIIILVIISFIAIVYFAFFHKYKKRICEKGINEKCIPVMNIIIVILVILDIN